MGTEAYQISIVGDQNHLAVCGFTRLVTNSFAFPLQITFDQIVYVCELKAS